MEIPVINIVHQEESSSPMGTSNKIRQSMIAQKGKIFTSPEQFNAFKKTTKKTLTKITHKKIPELFIPAERYWARGGSRG